MAEVGSQRPDLQALDINAATCVEKGVVSEADGLMGGRPAMALCYAGFESTSSLFLCEADHGILKTG